MPDFSGFLEGMKSALSGANDAKVMRPGEVALAERAATAGKGAPVVPGVQPEITPAPPVSAGPLPKLNLPPPEQPPPLAAQAPVDAGTPTTTAPPEPVTAPAVGPGTDPAPVSSPLATDALKPADAPPPADPAVPTAPGPKVPNPDVPNSGEPAVPKPTEAPTPPAAPELTEIQKSAQRMVDAEVGDFNLNAQHLPNINVLSTSDDVKAVLLRTAEDNKSNVDIARRGVVTDEQMYQLAATIPGGEPSVIKSVIEREIGKNLESPELALAARAIEANQAGTITGLADRVATGNATAAEIVAYKQQGQFLTEFNAQLMGAKAEAGRTERVLGMPVGPDGTLPPEAISHMADIIKANDPDIVREAKAIRLAGTPVGIANIVQGNVVRRAVGATMALTNRLFAGSILSGPPTWALVALGNTTNILTNASDLFMAAALGKFMPGDQHVLFGEAVGNLHGSLSAFGDAFKMAWRTLKTGESLDGVLRYKEGAPQKTLAYLPELDKPVLGSVVKLIDTVIDAQARPVSAIDEFSKTLGFRGYKESQAYVAMSNALEEGTLKQADAAAFVKKFMETNDPAIDQAAELWSHRMSFQDPLGDTGNKFQSAIANVPILRLIVPFYKTSTNIFKQGLGERTVLGLFGTRFWNAVAAGGPQRDLAIAKMATGQAIAALTARMVVKGDITGSAPTDPNARKIWELDKKEYSIRQVNEATGETTWHSLAKFEPMASVVGTIADIVQTKAYVNADMESDTMLSHDAQTDKAAAAVVAGIFTNLGNKSFMTGALQFSQMWADPQRGFANYAQHTVPSFIPYSKMAEFIRNESDPYQREAHTILDQIKSNMPYFSKGLPLDKDLFGQPRLKNAGSIMGVMSPIPDKTSSWDEVTKELVAVMQATKTIPVRMPDRLITTGNSGKGLEGGAGYRLTDREYSELVEYSRAQPIVNGKNFHDLLQETIDSSIYGKATPAMRAEMLSGVQIACDKAGRATLLKDNPDFAEHVVDWATKQNQLKYNQ